MTSIPHRESESSQYAQHSRERARELVGAEPETNLTLGGFR